MARPNRSAQIDTALLVAVVSHPQDLVSMVAAQLGLSRQHVGSRVKQLVADGYLEKSGSSTRPRYALGANRRFSRRYQITGLAEDDVWFRDLSPLLSNLAEPVRDIAHYGVTEMVNNCIDHSAAQWVEVEMQLDGAGLRLVVADDGIGIFRKITHALALPDQRLALLHLSKGKLTTDPRRHSGEGIFFTSRMFDRFAIHSGGLLFDHDHAYDDDWLEELQTPQLATGTRVEMSIARDSQRIMREVFSEYSSGPDDFAFAKTVVPVRLARVGDESLISRSQAKRLLQKVEGFRTVVLDFSEVKSIGQAFADEVFRVFPSYHPEIELVASNTTDEVLAMIRRAQALRDAQQTS